MTTAEACLFLGIEHPEEAEDAFENAVFTIRQQLIAGPVLLKTIESRCKRLRSLQQAYTVLTGEESVAATEQPQSVQLPETLPDLFTVYHQQKSALLSQLASTLNVDSIVFLANELIALERALIAPFTQFSDWGEAAVTIGKDADQMLVLQLVREQVELGRKSVNDLYENKNNLPSELVIVLKRLSLLHKFLYP